MTTPTLFVKLAHRGRVAVMLLACAGCASTPPAKDPAQAETEKNPPTEVASNDAPTLEPQQPGGTLRHPTSLARSFGWASIAVGAQAAIVAITTSFIMLDENATRSSECNAQKICSASGIDANGKIDALAPWNAGAWAVAVVGVGVGAYLVLTNPPGESKEAATAIGVGPNGSGVGLNVRGGF